MAKPLLVTVHDRETGHTTTAEVEPGNYTIVCALPCYLDLVQHHGNGTTVLTVKGRKKNLMGLKETSQ